MTKLTLLGAAAIAGAPYVDSYAYYDEPGYW